MNDTFSAPQQAPVVPPPKQPSTVGHWTAILVLLFLLGVSMLANLALVVVAIGASAFSLEHAGERKSFSEEVIAGSGKNKVVQLEANGVITFNERDGMFFGQEGLANQLLEQIEAAEDDPQVIAALLVVDSPGGGVTASDILYDRLLKFKDAQGKKRKLVVLMRDLAASGGYYISAAGDKIIAHRTTITGSIGVLLSTVSLKGLGDKVGVHDVTIKSGRNKDTLNPLREPTTEETNILQSVVNDMYERFVSVVARSRGLAVEKVRNIADGRIYTANQALELGLIDEIGYEQDARQAVKDLTGKKEIKIVRYKRGRSLMELFGSWTHLAVRLPFPAHWGAETPRFQYLWQPVMSE